MAYLLPVSNIPITAFELSLFYRLAKGVWDDADREAFMDFIAHNPQART